MRAGPLFRFFGGYRELLLINSGPMAAHYSQSHCRYAVQMPQVGRYNYAGWVLP